jgi:hypothetical protein
MTGLPQKDLAQTLVTTVAPDSVSSTTGQRTLHVRENQDIYG